MATADGGSIILNELFKNRIILLNGTVEAGMASLITSQLMVMSSQDEEKTITIYINSPGGEVDSGFSIIDTMNMVKAPVNTVSVGMCASMASLILSNGARRFILEHSRVMIHQVSCGFQGNAPSIEAAANETIRRNHDSMDFLARNCGKTRDELIKLCPVDLYLNAEEAVKFGIADEILTCSRLGSEGGK